LNSKNVFQNNETIILHTIKILYDTTSQMMQYLFAVFVLDLSSTTKK